MFHYWWFLFCRWNDKRWDKKLERSRVKTQRLFDEAIRETQEREKVKKEAQHAPSR